MKKNNKKKLPKYALGTRNPLGYQRSLGKSTTSTITSPEDTTESHVKDIKSAIIPGAATKAINVGQTFGLIALNTVTLNPGAVLSGFNAINKAGGFSNLVSKGATPFVSKMTELSENGITATLPTEIGLKTGDKAINTGLLNTTGIVLNAANAIKSGIDITSGIVNEDSHRSIGDMLNTRTKTTITGEGGNSYDIYSGPNSAAELEYDRQNRILKQVNLFGDAILFGASAGGILGTIFPGLGNLAGSILGGAVGAAGAGIASLAGYGDTEEDTKWNLDNSRNWTAGLNRQNKSIFDTKEMLASAANGKLPCFSIGKSPNARVSNGEGVGVMDNFGRILDIEWIPGKPNNEDNVKIHLPDNKYLHSFVISNKHNLSKKAKINPYAALQEQAYLQNTGQMNNRYKNGKLPKYALGLDALAVIGPHAIAGFGNKWMLDKAQKASVYAPDVYVDNPEGTKAVNTLAQLRFDADPYYREAQRGLNWANYDVRRNVGLGIGGRAIAQGMNYNNYLRGLADITKMKNEAQNSYAEKYANALANLGATNQGRRMEAAAKRHAWLQQAQGQKESWMAQYRKNIDQNLLNAAADYMRLGLWNASKDIQEKMLGLYERLIANEEYKTRNGMPDVKVLSTTVPTVTTPPQMIVRPTDDDIYSKILALAPWRQPQLEKPRSRDPYTNIYNSAPWHQL